MTDPSATDPRAPFADRLRVFTDAGLLTRLPTRWQLVQGTIEMTPFVLSSDATAERRYVGAPLGHPVLRQPLILGAVGLDHLRTGPALAARFGSVCKHLHLTYHQGMPVFDLQVIQTHPDGLARFRARTEELIEGTSPRARRLNALVAWILPRAADYYREFLGAQGWVARAERLDYPTPEEAGSPLAPEHYSLVGFLDYCAQAFPAAPRELPLTRQPAHLLRLAGRRFRRTTRNAAAA
ncbi:MAG: hypothetical protein IPK07_13505 [Deltaproteobacteria bacterium]|nr:hypothetical protein [Deltaproteobacteria bacterium]